MQSLSVDATGINSMNIVPTYLELNLTIRYKVLRCGRLKMVDVVVLQVLKVVLQVSVLSCS